MDASRQSRVSANCRIQHGQQQGSDWKSKLKAYGLAGIIAYGLLNTIYYTAMFMYMWTVVFKVPRGEVRSDLHCSISSFVYLRFILDNMQSMQSVVNARGQFTL